MSHPIGQQSPRSAAYRYTKDCPICRSSGYLGSARCWRCQGTGVILKPNILLRILLIALPFIIVGTILTTLMANKALAAGPHGIKSGIMCMPPSPTATHPLPLIDELNDTALMTAHSAFWATDAEHTHDSWFTDPLHPHGDNSRLERYPAHSGAALGAEWFFYHTPGAHRFTETLWHQAAQGNVIIDMAWTDENTDIKMPGGYAWHVTTFALEDSNFTVTQQGWGYINLTITVPNDKTADDVLFSFDGASTAGAQWANEPGRSEIDY